MQRISRAGQARLREHTQLVALLGRRQRFWIEHSGGARLRRGGWSWSLLDAKGILLFTREIPMNHNHLSTLFFLCFIRKRRVYVFRHPIVNVVVVSIVNRRIRFSHVLLKCCAHSAEFDLSTRRRWRSYVFELAICLPSHARIPPNLRVAHLGYISTIPGGVATHPRHTQVGKPHLPSVVDNVSSW